MSVLAILRKDLLLELRSRETVLPTLVFALLVVVIFNFALGPRREVAPFIAPAALWVAVTFAGILALGRGFTLEMERGGIQGMMLAPVGRDVLYLGKLLSSFLFILIVEILLLPAFVLFFNLPVLLPGLWLALSLGALGFAAVGTTFAGMAANARAREMLLPILFLPVVVPVIIAAVAVTGAAVQGDAWSEYSRWLGLMAAFDVIFVVTGAITFDFVLGE
jgi:heme exporter protein B